MKCVRTRGRIVRVSDQAAALLVARGAEYASKSSYKRQNREDLEAALPPDARGLKGRARLMAVEMAREGL